jgi:hypothetical protein
VRLTTGDRIGIRVSLDRPGYVFVLNIGPTGNLHQLWPDEHTSPRPVEPSRPLEVVGVEVTPPAGRERILAIWSRQPLPLDQALRLAGQRSELVSGPYTATRDLERVDRSLRQLGHGEWHAVVLELDHDA